MDPLAYPTAIATGLILVAMALSEFFIERYQGWRRNRSKK